MDAYFFYAGVFSFLFGVFLRSEIVIPWVFVLLTAVAGAVFLGSVFIWKEGTYLRLFALASIMLTCVSIGIERTALAPVALPSAFESLVNKKVSLEGIIVAQPDVREATDRLTVEIEQGSVKTRIIASTGLQQQFHVGDRVRISGTFKEPAPFDSDGGRVFRYDQFLAKDGIFGIVQPAQVSLIGRSGNRWLSFLRVLQYIKDTFDTAVEEAIPQPESALAIGIIAGGKQGLGKQLLDAFTVAGMLQIVVLSGYNVMIVAEGVLAVLRAVPKRAALIIAAVAITLFVLAAGAGTSAVRAGIMALIALTARGTHRTYNVLRALFIALVLMLLWNPLLLAFDPGLQLSFMATLGLILGSNLIERRLLWVGNATLREMLATTLAAQAAVLPLLLYQSGNLSLVAIPANLLAMPVLPAAMALSAIAALSAFFFNSVSALVPSLLGIPAYLLLAYVIAIADYSARIPFANIILPAFSAWLLIPAYAALGYAVWKAQLGSGVEEAAFRHAPVHVAQEGIDV